MAELPEGTVELVERALAEDIGGGDVTSEATVPEEAGATGRISLKEPGVVYGLEVAREVFRQAGVNGFEALAGEGQWLDSIPVEVAVVEGPARAILAGERTALNLLGHLSGVATTTARFVKAIEGSGARVLDTRKTTPGLRNLEKAAVEAGGGENHRFGLYDAILIKENHIVMAGGVAEAVSACREVNPGLDVEIEAETIEQVEQAMEAGADRILLDNMDLDGLAAAVAARDGSDGAGPLLEASGGIDLESAGAIASTGVDFLSIGSLTHSTPALDFSLLLD
ncbi:MAG: carboxylating nicotinate-nucleotide diphosphorylase [Solirubrobacterales bacterium]